MQAKEGCPRLRFRLRQPLHFPDVRSSGVLRRVWRVPPPLSLFGFGVLPEPLLNLTVDFLALGDMKVVSDAFKEVALTLDFVPLQHVLQ